MKKSSFIALVMGTVSGLFFAVCGQPCCSHLNLSAKIKRAPTFRWYSSNLKGLYKSEVF